MPELTFEDLEADGAAESQAVPTDDQLRSISATVGELVALQARMDKADEWMKGAKARREEIEATILPELMASVGIEQFTLADGHQIATKLVVSGSIPVAKREEAYKWLRDNKHGFLIKSIVSVSLGKGMDKIGDKVVAQLTKLGLEVERKESVHPQSLAAWAREIIIEGKPLPLDVLGIYVGRRATVK